MSQEQQTSSVRERVKARLDAIPEKTRAKALLGAGAALVLFGVAWAACQVYRLGPYSADDE